MAIGLIPNMDPPYPGLRSAIPVTIGGVQNAGNWN